MRPFQAGAKPVGTVEPCRRRQLLKDFVYRNSYGSGIATRMVVLDLAHMVSIGDPNKGHRSIYIFWGFHLDLRHLNCATVVSSVDNTEKRMPEIKTYFAMPLPSDGDRRSCPIKLLRRMRKESKSKHNLRSFKIVHGLSGFCIRDIGGKGDCEGAVAFIKRYCEEANLDGKWGFNYHQIWQDGIFVQCGGGSYSFDMATGEQVDMTKTEMSFCNSVRDTTASDAT